MGFCRGVSAFFVCFVSAAVGFFWSVWGFFFLGFCFGGGGVNVSQKLPRCSGDVVATSVPMLHPTAGIHSFPSRRGEAARAGGDTGMDVCSPTGVPGWMLL